MPRLQVTFPDGRDASFELDAEIITVGRLSDNMVQLDDGSVSSHHAQLTLEGGNYVLKDLNSTNGTRHNGVDVTDGKLSPGDSIRFGKVVADYLSGDAADVQPMPESDGVVATVADSSVRPSNFSNASPFTGKKETKDPVGAAVLGFAGLAVIGFAYALVKVMTIAVP